MKDSTPVPDDSVRATPASGGYVCGLRQEEYEELYSPLGAGGGILKVVIDFIYYPGYCMPFIFVVLI